MDLIYFNNYLEMHNKSHWITLQNWKRKNSIFAKILILFWLFLDAEYVQAYTLQSQEGA